MKPSALLSLLKTTIPEKLPLLIKGAPGIGKTDIVQQAATSLNADLIVEHPVISDPTDYKGLPFIKKNKNEADFLPFGNLKKILNADKLTVCFIDDLGQAAPLVQAACMQLILARRLNGHKVSDNICFIAATNRTNDRAGVSGILEPVKSRFVSIVELEVDTNEWISWALKNGLPTELIAFIRFRPELLFDFKPTSNLTNSPCPRTVHNVGKLMQAGIPPEVEYEVFAGAAGEGFAAEFVGFLKIFRTLPNPDVILFNPDSAPVPDDPATLYALVGALCRRASDSNFDRIVRYSKRLPAEYSVLLVRDCIQINPILQNTRAFIEWATDNQDVLI